MTTILFSDIHLNSNDKDSYRWNLFPWLREQARNYKVDQLIFLGDATDAKNKHDSTLVNRFLDEIYELNKEARLLLLAGNHDFVDPSWPFFKFTSLISDIIYIASPLELELPIAREHVICLFLPATKNYQKEWAEYDLSKYKFIFCHQTFAGVLGESGFPLPGIPREIFNEARTTRIYSGDIHSPQQLEGTNITYIGAPYRTNFGDDYTPRVLLIDNKGHESNLRFPCPNLHRVIARQLSDLDGYKGIEVGDLIKIKIKLKRSEYYEWPQLKLLFLDAAKARGWTVCGIELSEVSAGRARLAPSPSSSLRSPADLVRAYAKEQRLDDELTQIGLDLLGDVKI